jgi:dephospho-CoA kinase
MVIGITGGIATGKSAVCAMLIQAAENKKISLNALSADQIARDLLAPGSLQTRKAIRRFGQEYAVSIDAAPLAINRTKLASLIFSNSSAKKWLEELLHPLIIHRLERESASYLSKSPRGRLSGQITILEIPLLFEVGLEKICDRVLVASCSQETQINRIMARPGKVSADEAAHRIESQMPLREKVKRADFVLNTDLPLEQTIRDASDLLSTLYSALSER